MWTEDEEEQLKKLWTAGRPVIEIAHSLGRKPAATGVKAKRLGLPTRKATRRRETKRIDVTIPIQSYQLIQRAATLCGLSIGGLVAMSLIRDPMAVQRTAVFELALRERGRMTAQQIADKADVPKKDIIKIWSQAIAMGYIMRGSFRREMPPPKKPRPDYRNRDAKIVELCSKHSRRKAAQLMGVSLGVVSGAMFRYGRKKK